MPIPTARLMATRKGFALREAGASGKYRLIDSITGLPAVNWVNEGFSFTLTEAVAFLEPLHERVPRAVYEAR